MENLQLTTQLDGSRVKTLWDLGSKDDPKDQELRVEIGEQGSGGEL